MALIDADLLVRLLNRIPQAGQHQPPVNPVLSELNSIDGRLSAELADRGEDPTFKLKKINEMLTHHNTHADHYQKTPVGPPLKTFQPQPPTTQPQPSSIDKWETTSIDALPKTHQRSGKALFELIKNSGGKLSWNEQGQLLKEGRIIENSNIFDLVHAVTRQRKRVPPPGSQDFVSALNELNTPAELMANAHRMSSRRLATPKPGVKRPRRVRSSSPDDFFDAADWEPLK